MTWNDPKADPIKDIQAMLQMVHERGDLPPNKLILSQASWIELILHSMDLGRWPLRPIRRIVMRWALRRYFNWQAAAQDRPEALEPESLDLFEETP